MRAARPMILLTSLALVLGLATGCGDDDDGPETLRLVSDPTAEAFELVDVGGQGKTAGDFYAFDSPMLDPDSGEVAGHVYGTQTSISVEGDTEIVQAMITYKLADDSQILVGGTAEYPEGGDGLVTGEEHVRPILGGTGEYANVDGTVTTVRQSDGSYEQTFEFAD